MRKEQRPPSAVDLILARKEQEEKRKKESAELEAAKFQAEARKQWGEKFEDIDKRYKISDLEIS